MIVSRQLQDTQFSAADIAATAGYSEDLVEEWQFSGRIPDEALWDIAHALWLLNVQQATADPACPTCAWIESLEPDSIPPGEIADHILSCDQCRAREVFIRKTAGFQPGTGLVARITARIAELDEPWRSAGYGAALIVGMGAAGFIALPYVAVKEGDARFLLAMPALAFLLIVSGGIGGLAFHATSRFRKPSGSGKYLSGIVAAAAYLAAAFGMIGIAAFAAFPTGREEMIGAVTDPVNVVSFVGVWVFTSLLAGVTVGTLIT